MAVPPRCNVESMKLDVREDGLRVNGKGLNELEPHTGVAAGSILLRARALGLACELRTAVNSIPSGLPIPNGHKLWGEVGVIHTLVSS
jgi:hypothetical protein